MSQPIWLLLTNLVKLDQKYIALEKDISAHRVKINALRTQLVEFDSGLAAHKEEMRRYQKEVHLLYIRSHGRQSLFDSQQIGRAHV